MTTAELTHETSPSLTDESLYPHQASEGPLSPRDLANHVAQHPEQYHDTLVDNHIRPFIGKYGLDLVTDEHGNMQAEHTRSVDDILTILNGNKEGVLGTEDAHRLIDAGQSMYLTDGLDQFTDLDHNDIAHRLIRKGQQGRLVQILDQLNILNYTDIAYHLIDAGHGQLVAFHLNQLTGLDHNDIAHRLIDAGKIMALIANLNNFTGLEAPVAHRLIDAGQGWEVASNLANFTGLDHVDIAHRLIDAGQGKEVARNLKKFTGLDASVAQKLIKEGYLLNVLQHPSSFTDSLGELLLANSKVIEQDNDIADSVVENITDFQLSPDLTYAVLRACASQYSTAQKIAKLDLVGLVGDDQATVLREYIATIKPELHGVAEANPYSEIAGDMSHVTSSIPGTEFHERATQISKAIREKDPQYEAIGQQINEAYWRLRQTLTQQFDGDYAQRILGIDNTIDSMMPYYRRLVADFLAELEDIVDQESVSDALRSAQTAFMQVLTVDTGYYDKLYAEWDAKQVGQKEFQEVFLGRDGVYAYVGRRAQQLARQRLITTSGEYSELTLPTYLVYPRGFRDGLHDEAKIAYLNQSIDPDAAHFYDTGFTGTIPEDIMRVLGVNREDWEERIRLLSATERDRTVIGLKGDKSERDQIVSKIEHHVKDEKSAEGLYYDGEQLLSYAAPTSASERLAFRFTQMALHRHYYTQELAAEVSAAKRFVTQPLADDRMLRLDSHMKPGEAQSLTELVDHEDVADALSSHAKILKQADPTSEYPDEAVYEADLDGRSVIIKNIVRSKKSGPVDEFEALLLLERLKIDAPKPIARLFTGKQGRTGLVVMEKLSGQSGREIKHYFEQQQISAQNQEKILADARQRIETIAETVRRDIGLDKPWRLKDFMIEFTTNSDGEVSITSMKPIDFERIAVFDAENPKSIRLGQDLDT